MNTKTKSLLSAVLSLILSASQASVETTKAPNGATVTHIRVNGGSAFTFLNDGDTNGFLEASKDQVADTSALRFGYAYIDPTDPDVVILIFGAGEIPNSAFTETSTSAHLAVTTPFPVYRCTAPTGSAFCSFTAPTTPRTFDLTWVRTGERTTFLNRIEIATFGPVTTRSHGKFNQLTATVNGIWDGHTAADLTGFLRDTRGNTVIREVTMEANP